MSDEIFTSRASTFRLRDDGITHAVTLPDVFETLEDAKENIATVSRINQGKPVPVLADIRAGRGIDRETREYYSSKEGLVSTRALALLVESPFTRVMANFFIGINKPPVPTRLFTSEEEAIAWLKTFI
jgi:hypothetical protein